ncbi:hypothetical protein M9Y10_014480 [Tritrichomonas musculus]|uniref:IBR domain-containing protein n=1 Tax=Tritrichomonas musculus TaxID=1915356 RepID=A0ABR2KZN1_9EUKA
MKKKNEGLDYIENAEIEDLKNKIKEGNDNEDLNYQIRKKENDHNLKHQQRQNNLELIDKEQNKYLESLRFLNNDYIQNNKISYKIKYMNVPDNVLTNATAETTEIFIERFTQKCPFCGVLIMKNDGCNHVTCQHCGESFCWACGEAWSNYHYNCRKNIKKINIKYGDDIIRNDNNNVRNDNNNVRNDNNNVRNDNNNVRNDNNNVRNDNNNARNDNNNARNDNNNARNDNNNARNDNNNARNDNNNARNGNNNARNDNNNARNDNNNVRNNNKNARNDNNSHGIFGFISNILYSFIWGSDNNNNNANNHNANNHNANNNANNNNANNNNANNNNANNNANNNNANNYNANNHNANNNNANNNNALFSSDNNNNNNDRDENKAFTLPPMNCLKKNKYLSWKNCIDGYNEMFHHKNNYENMNERLNEICDQLNIINYSEEEIEKIIRNYNDSKVILMYSYPLIYFLEEETNENLLFKERQNELKMAFDNFSNAIDNPRQDIKSLANRLETNLTNFIEEVNKRIN